MNNIIVLCGKSSTGKDTLAGELVKEGYNFITSHSTRPMRENESEGNPYYFITKEKMKEYINNNELVEYREYSTLLNNKKDIWYYAVHKNEIKEDKKYVVVLDLQGIKEFKEIYKDRVTSINIEVNDELREQRARKRGSFCIQEWNRRLKTDKEDFSDKNLNIVDFTLQNIDIDVTKNRIMKLINLKLNNIYYLHRNDSYTLQPIIVKSKLVHVYKETYVFIDVKNDESFILKLDEIEILKKEDVIKYKQKEEIENNIIELLQKIEELEKLKGEL